MHLLHSDVKQYDNLVKTVYFLLKEYKKSGEKSGCSTITDKSGSCSKFHLFLLIRHVRISCAMFPLLFFFLFFFDKSAMIP